MRWIENGIRSVDRRGPEKKLWIEEGETTLSAALQSPWLALCEGEGEVRKVKTVIRDREGTALVEYGLLVTLVVMLALVGFQAAGTRNINTLFSTVATHI